MNLLKLFVLFFKIGLFTFGGGYAMIPLISSEVVAGGYLTEAELVDFIAVSESTPGPFAVNISTYIGMKTEGFLGALCCTLGVVMPSFLVILIIAGFYKAFKKNKVVMGIMTGLRPCVVGMIGYALISVGKTVFFEGGLSKARFFEADFYLLAVIFIISAVLAIKKIHPIIIILMSAVLGIILGYSLSL